MSRPGAHCQDATRWLKERGWNLAPLTGQDLAALRTISHCWLMWTLSDEAGRRATVGAVALLLDGCQEIVWPMARELIAQAGDWGHRTPVWDQVVERFDWHHRLRKLVDVQVYERLDRLARCHEGLAQVHP
jgi:hypothetical protein